MLEKFDNKLCDFYDSSLRHTCHGYCIWYMYNAILYINHLQCPGNDAAFSQCIEIKQNKVC